MDAPCLCAPCVTVQDYEAFWESFGRYVKLGCIEDGVRPLLLLLLLPVCNALAVCLLYC